MTESPTLSFGTNPAQEKETKIMILLIVCSLALTGLILLQNPKGDSKMTAQLVKASQSKTVLTKATWGLGVSVALITLIMM